MNLKRNFFFGLQKQSLTSNQLLVCSKHNGLYVENHGTFALDTCSFFRFWPIGQDLLLKILKTRGWYMLLMVISFLPFSYNNPYLGLIYGLLGVLLVVCLDLYQLTNLNKVIFGGSIRHMDLGQKVALGFFWAILLFALIILLLFVKVTFETFFNLWLLALVYYTFLFYQTCLVVWKQKGCFFYHKDMKGFWILLAIGFAFVGFQHFGFLEDTTPMVTQIICD